MFKDTPAFSGFAVDNIEKAKEFYGQTLGLIVESGPMGLHLKLASGSNIFVYPKEAHTPATYTILNFPVDNINQVVDALTDKGVVFEHYEGMTDARGIARGLSLDRGPDIAWFKDPAGNILSVLQERA
jgi:catechol 2,3-dioxygenase-like lactoylglutathione lyase family enzyme